MPKISLMVINAPSEKKRTDEHDVETALDLKRAILFNASQYGLTNRFPSDKIKILVGGKAIDDSYKFDARENYSSCPVIFPKEIEEQYKLGSIQKAASAPSNKP